MNVLIAYSSVTGNTRKLAKAIKNNYPDMDIQETDKVENVQGYDLILLGYWVNRGSADEVSKNFINNIEGKCIGVFGTSGQYPDSPFGEKYRNRVKDLVEDKNRYVGGYICLGKIQEERTEKRKRIPEGQPHYLTEEGLARHIESRKHPDQEDMDRLVRWVGEVLDGSHLWTV